MKKIDDLRVLISHKELLMLQKIISGYSSIQDSIKRLIQEGKEEYDISIFLAKSIVESLNESVNLISRYNLIGNNLDANLEDKLYDYLKKYIETQQSHETDEIDDLSITRVYEIIKINEDLYKLRDYNEAFVSLIKDLKYFCDENIVKQIEKKYKECLDKSSLEGLNNILTKAQTLIISHWQEYLTDPATYEENASYNFLCHSTASTSFKGGFDTEYVSCSLICDELTDTYRSGYGFIMLPRNIVAASSQDMYVINSARNDNELLNYSSIKKIATPERIKQEALLLKAKNRKNKAKKKVYTEIVIKGFEPQAIFFLDDGSKTLCYNYTRALKLKENFPNLEIVRLDKLRFKTEAELYDVRVEIIKSILIRLKQNMPIDEDYYQNFDLFWKEYLELIKRENYTEEDIIDLYKKNENLLSIFLDLRHLFDNTYDLETIRYILYYNYQTRIIDIINGKTNDIILDRLYKKLSIYKDNEILELAVPQISLFLKLYPNVEFTPDTKIGLKKCNSIESINNYLIELLNKKLENRRFEQESVVDELFKEDITYENINTFYKKIKELYDSGRIDNKNQQLLLFLRLYPLAVIDNQLLLDLSKIKNNDFSELNDCLLSSLSRTSETLEQKISKYQLRLDSFFDSQKKKEENIISYNASQEIISYEELYLLFKSEIDRILKNKDLDEKTKEEQEQELLLQIENLEYKKRKRESLKKHKLINRRKIKNIDIDIKRDEDCIELKKNFIEDLKGSILMYERHLFDTKNRFQDITKIDYDDFESKLKEALEIITRVDITKEQMELLSIKNTIARISAKLEDYKKQRKEYIAIESEFKK